MQRLELVSLAVKYVCGFQNIRIVVNAAIHVDRVSALSDCVIYPSTGTWLVWRAFLISIWQKFYRENLLEYWINYRDRVRVGICKVLDDIDAIIYYY